MEDTEAMDSRPPLAALSPSRQNTEAAGDVDFSKLTPSQFGISTDSFLSSSQIKDKSRVAQLKSRRRSTIGVRGSPETNSLICFRARQAAKTPPRTPQLLQGSPFLLRCDSLKKKMAAFQCLMEEEDEEDEQKKNEENGSAKNTLAKYSRNGKENTLTKQSQFTSMTPPPSKKRCWAPPVECEDKITETPLPYPTFTIQQEQGVKCSESQNQRSLSGVDSDAKNELLSLPMLSKPDVKPADDNMGSSMRKKKQVRFGAPLSPEFFDKTLPPSTPLQKGGTPMCPPSSTGLKRSLLKTPQRCDAPLPQPDFNSPQFNGASPVLVINRRSAGLLYSDEVFEEIEKISFPSMEEESPSHKPSKNCKDVLSAEDPRQPQAEDSEVMNAAFQEEDDEPSNSQTEEKLPCPTSDQPLALSVSTVEVDQESESSAISEKTLSSNSSTEPTRSRNRKRKQPGEIEPEKRRSSRTAAASASGKMKSSGVNKRFGNKVDRSLYGKRDYASKNPLLSPIFETMSTSLSNTPTQTQSGKLTDGEQDCIQTPNLPHSKTVCPMVIPGTPCSQTNENEQTLSSSVTDTTDNQPDLNAAYLEPSVGTQSPAGRVNSGSKTSKAKRYSGRPERQRRSSGAAKRKELSNTAINSTTESDYEFGEQDAESQKPNQSAGLSPMYRDSIDWPVRHEAECSKNKEIEALNSYVLPNEDSITTDRLEQKTPSNRRRGRVHTVLNSPCVKVDESGQSERITVGMSESNAGPKEPSLAPWQQDDFNIDDILKPVAKSRGSVRRSLRNRRSVDLQAVGLAWVDHTSPELSKAARRRTRGRLSGVTEPLFFQASEEPTPNLGE
ncbi:cell division cycle-associated protein 2 isoform X3 [Rhinichthys klamathensis goyatoka]|uniref:cell division cycle-associated protein 2 isoform X3 n=1 Tax=Rhinichthys klamathensis goyatoka TaxID=3034132 RepID=UPI0024B4C97B|nr:cell division cycle-associated protein 2 isoform X3 [Rhinichthys klamathensis goyatoka]